MTTYGKITDEEIEAACAAYVNAEDEDTFWEDVGPGFKPDIRKAMRAAIFASRAALAKQGKKKVRWINLYPPCDTTSEHPWRTTSWLTRELADRHAKPGRIACCRVAFNDGDGLMHDAEEDE